MTLTAPNPHFDIIQNKARKYGVPFWLMEGVYGMETGWGANVKTSSAGAMGPFQFIPSTATSYRYPLTNTPTTAQFDAQADAAARYLRDLYQQHGSWDAALRAYSGGGYGEGEVKAKAGPQLTQKEDARGDAKSFATQAAEKVDFVGPFLTKLGVIFKGGFWLRVLLVLGGGALLAFAVVTIGKQYVPEAAMALA